MVSALLSWNGISRPTIVDAQTTKVSGAYYTKHVDEDLLPAMNKLYPDQNGIFIQDGASSHTSNVCQQYLSKALPKGRKTNKHQWPAHSPDLNPLDYYFWNEIQTKVFEGQREPFQNTDDLTARIMEVWEAACEEDKLHRAILQFRPRLLAVMNEKGGPIKYMFK